MIVPRTELVLPWVLRIRLPPGTPLHPVNARDGQVAGAEGRRGQEPEYPEQYRLSVSQWARLHKLPLVIQNSSCCDTIEDNDKNG